MWIDAEERPAGITGVNTTFQPRNGLVRIAQGGIHTRNLIIGVVRMAERAWRIERPANTLEGRASLVSPGVEHALRTDDQGLFGVQLQPRGQALLRCIQVAQHQRRERMIPQSISGSWLLSDPVLPGLFRSREVPAEEVNELEVIGPGSGIREPRPLVGDVRVFKSPDMPTYRRHPVVGPLIIRLRHQNLFQCRDGIGVLEILGRAPQDECPGRVSLR